MKIELEFPISPDEFYEAMEEAKRGNARPLRDLCQKERERFEVVVQKHPHYADGLVVVERLAVEGYLYQKLRGHIDASPEVSNLSPEG
jgi:hypothetical protein